MTTNKNSTRYYSSRQEKKVAKSLNGRVVSNSGATPFRKGDIDCSKFTVECKTCVKDKEQFTIKKEWLIKNRQEAFAMNKEYSALAFNFGPDQENYFIIDSSAMEEFVDWVNHRSK